jgi:hypothetical protein
MTVHLAAVSGWSADASETRDAARSRTQEGSGRAAGLAAGRLRPASRSTVWDKRFGTVAVCRPSASRRTFRCNPFHRSVRPVSEVEPRFCLSSSPPGALTLAGPAFHSYGQAGGGYASPPQCGRFENRLAL